MPFFPANIAVVTAKLVQTGNDQDVQNTYVISSFSGPTDDASAIADISEWLEAIYTPIQGQISTLVAFSAININNISRSEVTGDLSWPNLVAGTNAGDILPSGVAALCLQRTGVSRRVGRKYYGVFTEAALAAGQWVSGTINDLGAAIAVASDPYVGANGVGFVPYVYDRTLGTLREVTSTAVSFEPAYQRRRRRGSGS